MMLFRTLLIVLFVFSSGLFANSDTYLFIFDASGSMRKEINLKRKIDIAKKILIDTIKEINDDSKIGLIVFGNGIKGAYSVRFIVRPKKGNKQIVIEKVKKFIADGTTPLAGSINFAGEFVKKYKEPVNVILITDGREECGGNPVASAERLQKEGVDIKFHIIGLAVDKEIKKELNKIAKAGGGKYYQASTAVEFQLALMRATNIKKFIYYSNVLTISAPPGETISSKVLHKLKDGEVIKIKFKPIRKYVKKGYKSSITFQLENVMLEINDDNGKFVLQHYKNGANIGNESLDNNLSNNKWNECEILKKNSIIIFSVNGERILDWFSSKSVLDKFKVKVSGFEVEFKDLSVSLPLN